MREGWRRVRVGDTDRKSKGWGKNGLFSCKKFL